MIDLGSGSTNGNEGEEKFDQQSTKRDDEGSPTLWDLIPLMRMGLVA